MKDKSRQSKYSLRRFQSSKSNRIVWCIQCNSICLLGFNSNFLLGLFNQTCRKPNTIGSPHFRGSLRWLLFNFNDITYHQPVCVSIYSFLFWWNIKKKKRKKKKWKSSFAWCQGTFLLSFARRCDWNESVFAWQVMGIRQSDAVLTLCKGFKPPIISVHCSFEKSRFLVIFWSGLDL